MEIVCGSSCDLHPREERGMYVREIRVAGGSFRDCCSACGDLLWFRFPEAGGNPIEVVCRKLCNKVKPLREAISS